MAITRADVLRIAELAKLHFSEAELQDFAPQFQHIMDYIEKLKNVDIEGVEPTSHVSPAEDSGQTLLRKDAIRPSLPVAEALKNAPDENDDHFLVPKVI